MKYRLFKDRRRRLLFSLFEPRRNTLRSLVENLSLPSSLRGQAYRALLLLPRDSSPTRRRNRCTLTGRSRSILRHFGLSRLRFRKLALEGKLVGIKKATWLLHLFLSMSTLTNNVYKPRYTIAYLASSKVWSYKNSRLRRIISLRGRRFFRGGLFRRYVLVATTRKWTEARRRFRPFRLRLGRGRAGGVGLSVLGRPRRRRYRDIFYTKQQLRAFHGKRSERWIQNTLKRASFHATAVRGVRSRSFIASLESRLDRVLFRSRLFPTIFACHQYVHHLGLSVNGVIERSPQAILRPGDILSLAPYVLANPTNPRQVTSRSVSAQGSDSALVSASYADTQEVITPGPRFKWADSTAKRLSRWRTVYWDLFCRIYYRRWGLFTVRRRHLSHLKKKLRPFVLRRPSFGIPSTLASNPVNGTFGRVSALSGSTSNLIGEAHQSLALRSSPYSMQAFRQYTKVWLALRLRSSFLPRFSEAAEVSANFTYRRSRPSRRRTRHRFIVSRRRKAERSVKTPRLRPVHFYVPPYLHVDTRTLRTVRLWSPTSETVVYPFRASPAQIEVFYRSRGFLFFVLKSLRNSQSFPFDYKRFFILAARKFNLLCSLIMLVTAAKLIGAGIATTALAGVGVGAGLVFSSLLNGVARNPNEKDELFRLALLGFALIEALALFALRRAFLILFTF